MKRDEALTVLANKRAALANMGVKSIALFGSIARDEGRLDSDVDLLVEFEGRATYDAYLRLKTALEEWLGCRVDLVTRRAVKPRLRSRIEAEAIYVA